MGDNIDDQANAKRPIGADRSVDLATEQDNAMAAPLVERTATRSHRRLLFIALALFIVAVVTIIGGSLALINRAKQPTANPLAASTKFGSPKALVDKVEPSLKGQVMEAVVVNGVGGVNKDGFYAYSIPSHRVSGEKFDVMPLVATGTGYTGDSIIVNNDYATLIKFFTANKFVKNQEVSGVLGLASDAGDASYVTGAEYESSDLLCDVRRTDATSTALRAHTVSVGCADKDSYKQAVDVLRPFYDAYVKDKSNASNNLTFGMLQTGETDGYKYAMIFQDDDNESDDSQTPHSSTGYYYHAPDVGEWTYLTTVSMGHAPVCSIYNTDTLKKAFKGTICYEKQTSKQLTL